VAPRLEGLLAGLTFVQGSATSVDLESQQVTVTAAPAPASVPAPAAANGAGVAAPLVLPFDRVVVALGSEAADLANVPGAQAHALPFYTIEHAEALQVLLRGSSLGLV
jgi:NADH dehydrogenase FAD-containing subunit